MTATRKTLATLTALGFPWFVAAWFLWETTVPADLDLPDLRAGDYFTAAQLDETADYERFVRLMLVLSLVAAVAALVVLVRRIPKFAGQTGLGPIGTGMVVGMIMLVVLWAVDLPFAIALRWWEQHHDLTKGSWIEWLVAPWQELGASVAFVMFQIAVIMALARRFRRFWWIPVTPVFLALVTLFLFLFPYLDAGQVHRPASPELRRDIRALAEKENVEGTPVDVEKVSNLTTQANAYAAGLGPSIRVVLYDTLLDGRFAPGEVRTVVAHEFGHVERRHLYKGLGWTVLFAFPIAFVVAEVTRRRGGLGEPGVLPYGLLVLIVVNVAVAPITNVISRRYEAEADWTALQATRDSASMEQLMKGFAETSLAQPDPPGWAHLWLDTHPTLLQRIAMAEAWKREKGGG